MNQAAQGKAGSRRRSAATPAVGKVAAPVGPEGPNVKLTQLVFHRILRAIVYGRLDLGEPLSESDLAGALHVSKAPVRESLNELRLKGLVVVVPQSGSYVFSPTREQIEELCDFRSLLESSALRASMRHDAKSLIADLKKTTAEMRRAYRQGDIFLSKRLDTQFHQALFERSANRYLAQSYENIRHSVEALRHRFMDTAVYRNQAFAEHRKLVELLEDGALNKAAAMLHEHIARTKRFQARASWSPGRLRRKDYKFRDYSQVFLEE